MSNTATDTALADPPLPERVMSTREWAALASISYTTARWLLANGQGPHVTRLSPGRIGVTVRDFNAWLAERGD